MTRNNGGGLGAKNAGPSSSVASPTESVRARAFEIFQARKGEPGDAHADWARAEHELTDELPNCGGDDRANAIAMLHDRIRARAFELYRQRMAAELADWLAAERELSPAAPVLLAPPRGGMRHAAPRAAPVRMRAGGSLTLERN